MDKLLDLSLGLFGRILEPILDQLNEWMTIVVSLNGQATFKEDKDGFYRQEEGSAVILVINHGRQPIKVFDVGLIFKDGQKLSVKGDLAHDVSFPHVVDAKDHAYFIIRPDLLVKLGSAGLDAIKYVYMSDATFKDFKSRVPRQHKMHIEASLNRRIVLR